MKLSNYLDIWILRISTPSRLSDNNINTSIKKIHITKNPTPPEIKNQTTNPNLKFLHRPSHSLKKDPTRGCEEKREGVGNMQEEGKWDERERETSGKWSGTSCGWRGGEKGAESSLDTDARRREWWRGKLWDRSLEKEWGTLGLASPLMNSDWPRTRYAEELAGLSPLGEASNRRMADFYRD